MPSHTSRRFPRRSALALLGIGSAGFIASCLSRNQGSATNSDETRTDFAGEVKFDTYDESAGVFKPATRDHPAQNVPVPIRPEHMNDKSVRGLYNTIAYISAALQYMNATGNTRLYDESAAAEPGHSVMHGEKDEKAFSLMREGRVWFDNPAVTVTLKTSEPTIKGDTYTWEGKTTLDYGTFQVGEKETVNLSLAKRYEVAQTTFTAVHRDDRWWCKVSVPEKIVGAPERTDLFSHFRMRVEDLTPTPVPTPEAKK